MKITALSAALALGAGSLLFTACSPKAALPEAPDAAMRKIADELGAGNSVILWTATPATYQKDVTELVHLAGAKLDPEVYDRGFSLLTKLSDVLGKQRAFILSSQMAGQIQNKEQVEAGWDNGVAILRSLATSKLATVEGLKTFDGAAFLDSTGDEILGLAHKMSANSKDGPLAEQIKKTVFTVENVTETSATLNVKDGAGVTDTTTLTKVDGRWVPADMAAEWTAKIAEAKKNLADLKPEEMAQSKPQILGALAMAEGVITQLDAAKTQAEFDQALQGAMMPLMGLMMMGQSMSGGGMSGGAPTP
jgi:hypothetical protein